MQSWPSPLLPEIRGERPTIQIQIYDTASAGLVDFPVQEKFLEEPVRMYVCGITPYDSAHIGHAATYIAFDLLHRLLLDSGRRVHYVQNITDVDDPLLERAQDQQRDWRQLAEEQVSIYRQDMKALHLIPPTNFVGVVESMPKIVASIKKLLDSGSAYYLDSSIYFDIGTYDLNLLNKLSSEQRIEIFAQRGGDPTRIGKRHQLDPILWKYPSSEDEPRWETELGIGRPGWHIECVAIALDCLDANFHLQGGGSDLIFPHHTMSAAQGCALTSFDFAQTYAHTGMVSWQGSKMSKSLGNLVFVHDLIDSGIDPMAVRLAIMAHHYRSDWAWSDFGLNGATERLALWRAAMAQERALQSDQMISQIRASLADDLSAPRALEIIDDWARVSLSGKEPRSSSAGLCLAEAIDALLGIRVLAPNSL